MQRLSANTAMCRERARRALYALDEAQPARAYPGRLRSRQGHAGHLDRELGGAGRVAERELGIDNPAAQLQPLRADHGDPMLLTAEEVNAFLDMIDPAYRLYFKLRFRIGLSSCEVNRLKVGHLDLDRRQLRGHVQGKAPQGSFAAAPIAAR